MAFECPKSTKVSQNLVAKPGIGIVKPFLLSPKRNTEGVVISNFVPNTKRESGKGENSKGASKFNSKKGTKASASTLNQSSFDGDKVFDCRRSFIDLPPALISEILNCLDPKDLGVVSCVSTILYRLASEHHAWKEFYCQRWGLPTAPMVLDSGVSDDKSWKELFMEREFRSKTFMGRFSLDALYGHTEAVRTVFLLASAKLIFTSGYDSVVRMWDVEDGLSIASSRPLGCTIRAVAADRRLLVAGGTGGFIHCWRAVEGLPHLFDVRGSQNQNTEVRLWGHEGPITSLALDLTRIYSGSWDTTVRVWDRHSMKCTVVLRHSDWVWGLVPHDTTIASTSGSDVYVWDTNSGTLMTIVYNAHAGNTYALARSHTGDFLFTGGEDGAIHMYEIINDGYETKAWHAAAWVPHSGPVYSLAFEFPWLVSASSDGKLALIDVRKLVRSSKRALGKKASKVKHLGGGGAVEPPQRMLNGFKSNLFSVDIGADRIVCGGEEGVVRIWNFTEALEIERRVRTLRGIRLENRMRRRKLQTELGSKGGQSDQCSVAAKKNSATCIWPNKCRMSGKLKA
ncbi:F-box/WD-40 repeat-containing protein At5g21040 [Gastrolobium bilobum]|uniref:F-box/WD-40 repeat-containing protein At5g21040 n=1 Tax=Gastrolobium bilobum TaxID=150636 RepID=UPI002AB040A2|nr:F-box/WD-40 repeat-containing protein At5g21040 [Gastrolobium bilobum]